MGEPGQARGWVPTREPCGGRSKPCLWSPIFNFGCALLGAPLGCPTPVRGLSLSRCSLGWPRGPQPPPGSLTAYVPQRLLLELPYTSGPRPSGCTLLPPLPLHCSLPNSEQLLGLTSNTGEAVEGVGDDLDPASSQRVRKCQKRRRGSKNNMLASSKDPGRVPFTQPSPFGPIASPPCPPKGRELISFLCFSHTSMINN